MRDRAPKNNVIRRMIDISYTGLEDNPYFEQKVLQKVRGEDKMKKKAPLSLAFAIAIFMIPVIALAAGLANYFGLFSELENQHGEYTSWPGSAKVALVEGMSENGVLSQDELSLWTSEMSAEEKEIAASTILDERFSDMVYVDTYNIMTQEWGAIEQWTDAQRAEYTALMKRAGRFSDVWPEYQLPSQGDLIREQAIARAKNAVLAKFTITSEELEAMPVDAAFVANALEVEGVKADEPIWHIAFGYGLAYRVRMTRSGEMLELEAPQTSTIRWGRGLLDGAIPVVPSAYDISEIEAISQAQNALMEIADLPSQTVEDMKPLAQFIISDLYAHGNEPVWLVSMRTEGMEAWNVLLSYDGGLMDIEPDGKLFDQVLPQRPSLSDYCRSKRAELGLPEIADNYQALYNAGGIYYHWWTLEEKAAFYQTWAPVVNAYVQSHPYFTGEGEPYWEFTREVSGIPDDTVISQDEAMVIAEKAFPTELAGLTPAVSFYVTDADHPVWCFRYGEINVMVNARTGEVINRKQ